MAPSSGPASSGLKLGAFRMYAPERSDHRYERGGHLTAQSPGTAREAPRCRVLSRVTAALAIRSRVVERPEPRRRAGEIPRRRVLGSHP
jgi:hypothetical protein